MDIIQFVIILIVVGFLLWLVNNYIPMDRKIKQILNIVVVIAASLCLTGIALFASESDDWIESSIKKSYVFKRYLKDENIRIQSKDGAVTLTGSVFEDSQRSLAHGIAANQPGVKSVDNKIELKKETPAVYSDAWLMTKVKTTLLFHRNVSGTATEVFAENGTITLRGEASGTAQKDLATEYALDVDGVKTVNNMMTVAPSSMAPDPAKKAEKDDTVVESIDDASISALVKTTLLYHRSTSSLNIIVSTKDGMVKLKGIVNNAAEKDLAGKLASDVHGVTSVSNDMALN